MTGRMTAMEILHSLDEAAAKSGPSVVTIGSFDGIHLAHQELLRRIGKMAAEQHAASVAITFHPHPVEVLRPSKAPKLITPLPVKVELMERSGIDRLLLFPFTEEFSHWSPEKFVEEVLSKALHAKAVMIGENFCFGYKQSGRPPQMEELGHRFGFETHILPDMWYRKMMVSSSQIRRLLEEGRIVQANRLLGRPFSIRGPIERGLGIGSKETVPTLNLGPYSGVLPAAGVYVTWTRLVTRLSDAIAGSTLVEAGKGSQRPTRLLRSVTNVGRRPTFGERELGVETHLLEPMSGSQHDQTPSEMEVSFLYRLRDERKFDSPQELKAQIMKDVQRADGYFRRVERFQGGAVRGETSNAGLTDA